MSSLHAPQVKLTDRGLYSHEYGDIYFNDQDPEAEAEHVFLGGSRVVRQWSELSGHGRSFTIAETGFGAGFNFFVTLKHWLAARQPGQCLHYVSLEHQPLSIDILKRLYESKFPAYCEWFQALAPLYPPPVPGPHRLSFPHWGLALTLVWQDATRALEQMAFVADVWYLDGFAPSRNPDIWSNDLFSAVADHSKPGTRFSTFTVSGNVRRGLIDVGFEVQKQTGFGQKREMLVGVFKALRSVKQPDKPWFAQPNVNHSKKTPNIGVIGAGLMGTALASRLATAGAAVTLYDRYDRVAQAASGNQRAVLFYRPSVHLTEQGQFHRQAYLHSLRELSRAPDTVGFTPCGVLQLAHTQAEQQHQQKVMRHPPLPDDWLLQVTARQASALAGVDLMCGGLFYPKSGFFNPVALCQWRVEQLRDNPLFNLQLGDAIEDLGPLYAQHDHLILATGAQLNDLLPQPLPIRSVRGQTTHLSADSGLVLGTVLCYDGYCLPRDEAASEISLGATFVPGDVACEVRESEHLDNLSKLGLALSGSQAGSRVLVSSLSGSVTGGRVGIRAQLPDYLPLVGAVPDQQFYLKAYENLGRGDCGVQLPPAQYLSGLWVCSGFGAKGGTLSTLAADLMCHYIMGSPSPVTGPIQQALHPGRFIVRALKKRRQLKP